MNEFDDRDAFRAVHVIRDAVPTNVHAEMLFGLVTDLLGDAAWIETSDGGTKRVLFRREAPGSDTVVPWPLLSLCTTGRHGIIVPMAGPDGTRFVPPRRPGRAPKLRNLGPGEILIHDGPQSVTLTYDDDGRWMEVTRGGPKETLWGAIDALAQRTANPVELLAGFLAEMDVRRHGPGLAYLPVPLPGGAQGVWLGGLFALRQAVFEGRVPEDAKWAVADGYTSTAIAWGATREDAMAAWRVEVERTRPFPAAPQEPPVPLPKSSVETTSDPEAGTFRFAVTMRGSRGDAAMPVPAPANTPAALIPLAPPPKRPPPVGAWTRLLGRSGATVHGALLRRGAGFLLIGERLAETLGPGDIPGLERDLDLIDIEVDARPVPVFQRPPGLPDPPKMTHTLRVYGVEDEADGEPKPTRLVSGRSQAAFHARDLDGDKLAWAVVRQRPLAV